MSILEINSYFVPVVPDLGLSTRETQNGSIPFSREAPMQAAPLEPNRVQHNYDNVDEAARSIALRLVEIHDEINNKKPSCDHASHHICEDCIGLAACTIQ